MFSFFFDGQALPSAAKKTLLWEDFLEILVFFQDSFWLGLEPGVAGPGAWGAMDLDSIEFLSKSIAFHRFPLRIC